MDCVSVIKTITMKTVPVWGDVTEKGTLGVTAERLSRVWEQSP